MEKYKVNNKLDKFHRFTKAVLIASALVLATSLLVVVSFWSKGLFILLMLFAALVAVVYSELSPSDSSRKDYWEW